MTVQGGAGLYPQKKKNGFLTISNLLIVWIDFRDNIPYNKVVEHFGLNKKNGLTVKTQFYTIGVRGMFDKIDFRIQGNLIEVERQTFPLGELTADILNITSDEFDQLYALYERLGQGGDEEAMRSMRDLLMKRKLFALLAPRGVRWSAGKFREIVSDIYSFNQTMFRFIDKFLMRLKKLDPENYAAALYDFYTHPGLDKMMVNYLRNPMHSFTFFDSIDVRFIPMECPGKPDHYAVYEVYSSETLQGFLKMDFMKAVMAGHVIRRCQNCKRFFLLTQGYKTIYCDRPLADNPKRTCRQQGAKNLAKQKAAGNPVLRGYNKAYQRVTADKNRNRITDEEWRAAKRALADIRDMAKAGRLSDRETEARMDKEALYQSLNITRRGGR